MFLFTKSIISLIYGMKKACLHCAELEGNVVLEEDVGLLPWRCWMEWANGTGQEMAYRPPVRFMLARSDSEVPRQFYSDDNGNVVGNVV